MNRFLALNFLAVVFLVSPSVDADTAYRANPVSDGLFASNRYAIVDTISWDGLINTYTLETGYGRIRVDGTPLLMVRAHELEVLARMQQLEESEVFKQALKQSARSPLTGAAALIEAPIPTLKGAASGVGRWFSDVGRAIISDDPHQANAAKTALGQATAKRAFAYQFGVDPYSSFKPLQEKLDDIAWAAAGGGLTIKAVFSMIPDVVGTVVAVTGTTEGMRALVRDNSPAQLAVINRKKLKAMKTPDSLADALLANAAYTPQELTILIGEIYGLKSIRGRGELLAAAARVEDEAKAVFMRYRVQMIAKYVQRTQAKGGMVAVDQTLFLKTDTGKVVGHFPVDMIHAAPELTTRLAHFDKVIGQFPGVKQKLMFVGGRVDIPVLDTMRKSGWEVNENQFHQEAPASLGYVQEKSALVRRN